MATVVVNKLLSETSFGVIFSGSTANGERLTVRLTERIFPSIGDVLELSGRFSQWTDRRGLSHRQFVAERADRVRTSGRLLGPWLQSLPAIGPERAKRLMDRFGPDLLDMLGDADHLEAISETVAPGRKALGDKLAGLLLARFASMKAKEDGAVAEGQFYQRLEEFGVSDRRAAKSLFRILGAPEAWDKLLQIPYMPAALLPWKQADHLGLRLLATRGERNAEGHDDRLIGACDAVWRQLLAEEHSAALYETFLLRVRKLGVDPERALALGISAKRVLDQGGLLRAPGAAWLEKELARTIKQIRGSEEALRDLPAAEPLRKESAQTLTAEQLAAVETSLVHSFSLIQGSAGTGKTTTLRTIVIEQEARGRHVVLAALSGKAALRLSRATSRRAYTIARLLRSLAWARKLAEECRPLSENDLELTDRSTLIVDEASMVDLVSWQRLMAEVPVGGRVLLVGDTAQLAPVGLGCVFHDLVSEGRNLSQLTEIIRQSASNPIIATAHAVRLGQVPALPLFATVEQGAFFAECSPEDIERTVLHICQQLTEAGTAANDILVLAALRATCDEINATMQRRREKEGAAGIRLGPLAAYVAIGDPVICTRNRYDEALMNGLMGRVASLDPLLIHFDGEDEPRQISQEAVFELQSAWAITCHRAQGSEARRVVVALDGSGLLNREWLYTALTRATDQVVLVGPVEALSRGVKRRAERLSGFLFDLRLD